VELYSSPGAAAVATICPSLINEMLASGGAFVLTWNAKGPLIDSASPISARWLPLDAEKSRATGAANASIDEKTCPRRIASITARASADAFALDVTFGSAIKMRNTCSYPGVQGEPSGL
jgi:hypothetical protein